MKLYLAVEGGGSFTRVGLYGEDRALMREVCGGPCNPTEYSPGVCIETITALVRELTREPVEVVAAAISGVGRGELRSLVGQGLLERLNAARVCVAGDLYPTLIANVGTHAGVYVVAGTGSSVLAQAEDGRSMTVGGRGRILGDDGSGYQLAVSALRAAADAVDGVGPATALVAALTEAKGFASFDKLIPWSIEASKKEITELALAVMNSAETNDAVAQACVRHQAERLAAQTLSAFDRLSLAAETPVLVHGGLFGISSLFRQCFETAMCQANPGARIEEPALRGQRVSLELAFLEPPYPDWMTCLERGQAGPAAESLPRTESAAPSGPPLDELSALEIVRRMNREDAGLAGAVARQEHSIAMAIERVTGSLGQGGRLIYVGAGTSGRLGVLDASECPPTFGIAPERVLGITAGGERALRHSVENAEDDEEAARRDLAALNPALSREDTVVGIAASGGTPYVRAALRAASEKGATTVLLCCNPQPPDAADIVIALDTGPEVLPGSTRLKAGTATKLVLNMISTGAMARAGYVYKGLMVGVRPINEKLRRRAGRIVAALTGLGEQEALALLRKAGDSIPVAVVMHRLGLAETEAREKLKRAGGRLRDALGE